MMDTRALDANVIKLNEVDDENEYTWQFEGLDTSPYVYLHVGNVARIRGTLDDLTEMTREMLEPFNV